MKTIEIYEDNGTLVDSLESSGYIIIAIEDDHIHSGRQLDGCGLGEAIALLEAMERATNDLRAVMEKEFPGGPKAFRKFFELGKSLNELLNSLVDEAEDDELDPREYDGAKVEITPELLETLKGLKGGEAD